jgi:hypothetical protein
MHIYSVSPDLFKNNRGFDDDYDNWMYGCFKSKWDHRKEDFEFDDELDNFKPELIVEDTMEHKEFNPITLKED